MKLWLDKAKDDLRVSESNFKIKELSVAAIFCQQSVEKALKAVYIKKHKQLAPKTHDILFLATKVDLPDNLADEVDSLTDVYMESRYPDIKETIKLKEENVSKFIKSAKKVLEWCEKQI